MSADLREVLDLAEAVRILSDGAFDIRGHRPDGAPDPTGLVKGWAVERAAAILVAGGVRRLAINAGGDVVVRGGTCRRAAVADRRGDTRTARHGVRAGGGRSVRGHLRHRGARAPHHRRPHREPWPGRAVRQVTVAGPSLARADGYATGAFAMGVDGLRWSLGLPGYGAAAVTADGRLLTTEKIRTWRVAAPG